MHDKDTRSITKRINNSSSVTLYAVSGMVTQIVANCSNAGNGSNWVLTIKDGASPAHTWYGPITLGVSSNGPVVTQFNSPVRFSDGIVATTTGNAGVLDLAVSVLNTDGQ